MRKNRRFCLITGKSDTAFNQMFRARTAAYLLPPTCPEQPEQVFYMAQTEALLNVDFGALDFDKIFEEVRQTADQPLPDRSVEDGPNDDWVKDKEYSNSDRMREVVRGLLGSVALQETVTLEDLSLEVKAAIVSLRDRQKTSIIEMIQTHPELRAVVEINYERKHLIRGGHVMALDGKTRMTNMLDRGEEKAKQDAETNPLMVPLARRTSADNRFGRRVETLQVGECLVGPSAYEDSADELFMRSIGWHKGLSFWQAACRVSEDVVMMFSYSVDPVPSDIVRKVWEGMTGTAIPRDVLADTWQDYSQVFKGGIDECRQMLRDLRAACYKETGDVRKRFTLEDIFAMNEQASKEIFNKLYMRVTLGAKDKVIEDFVRGLLADPEVLNEDVYRGLVEMQGRSELTKEDASLLEHLVRYAEAQHYCTTLRAAIASGETVTQAMVPTFQPVDVASLERMARALSMQVLSGARSNTILGGCTRILVVGKGRSKSKGDSGQNNPEDPVQSDEADGGAEVAEGGGICLVDSDQCYCCPYNSDGSDRTTRMTILAVDDGEYVSCLRSDCGAWFDKKTGQKYIGRIAERALERTEDDPGLTALFADDASEETTSKTNRNTLALAS